MYNPGGISTAKELTKMTQQNHSIWRKITSSNAGGNGLFMICYVLKNSEFNKIGSEERTLRK